MATKSLEEVLKEIEKIYDEDCFCTEAQLCGDSDPSLCRSCNASYILNQIDEEARYGLRTLTKVDEPES